MRSNAGRLGPGVDVRGAGGYSVLPPSLHESGRRYEWLDRGGQHGGPRAVAPVPASLLAPPRPARVTAGRTTRIRPSTQRLGAADAYAQAALRGEVQRVRLAREGTRNDTLNRAAFALGQFAGAGMLAQGPVEAALVEAALATGLDEPEARRTFGSGFYAGLRQPRVLTAAGWRSRDASQPPPTRRIRSEKYGTRPYNRQSGVSQRQQGRHRPGGEAAAWAGAVRTESATRASQVGGR